MLVDRFLEDATEVDVDALRDVAGEVLIGGIMEHVEEAGVHSGDSACVLPPQTLSAETLGVIADYTRRIAEALDVQGLVNVQYAVKSGQVFVIEANPRASRTVPFVAKATGVPLAKAAARVMVGATLAQLRDEGILHDAAEYPGADGAMGHVAIKEAVLPFNRFPDADAVLGPEMRSTGEVMGIDASVGRAFAKAQLAAGTRLPESGTVFLSLADRDKETGLAAAVQFTALGFELAATAGTAAYLRSHNIDVAVEVAKIGEQGTDAVALIAGGKVGSGGEQPEGSRTTCRRRPHPGGRRSAPGSAAHHGRSRSGGGKRDGRPQRACCGGAVTSGLPPGPASCPQLDVPGRVGRRPVVVGQPPTSPRRWVRWRWPTR